MATNPPKPIGIERGQFSGGDPARTPEGYLRKLRNCVWEDTWVSRPPFTYDAVASVRGLAAWHDEDNESTRLISLDSSRTVRAKNATGETWASLGSTSSSVVAGLLDYANFRDQIFLVFHDSNSVPRFEVSVGGALSTAFLNKNSANAASFVPYTAAVFKERVFFGGVYLQWQNQLAESSAASDYAHNATHWTKTTVTATSSTVGSTTLYQITPTAVTGSLLAGREVSSVGFQSDGDAVYFAQFRGVHETYRVPLTLQIKYGPSGEWAALTAYAAGNIIVPVTPNGSAYKCKTAGTTAAGEPAWTTTVGAEFVDGSVTWICIGSDVIEQHEVYVPSASDESDWVTYIVRAHIPFNADAVVQPVIKFGTESAPSVSLAPIDFAYKDGLADGSPRKQSRGHQFTIGSLAMPFSNVDALSDDPSTLKRRDYIYWTEVGDPELVREENFYVLRETPGHITGVRAVGDYLVVSKRDARWVFASSEDVNYVILPVGGARRGAGWLNAKACDIADDGLLYYVGENGVYRWNIDDEPEELCGEAMLREMFDKSAATWCESQASPANRALLTIDQKNKRLYVYVQKGRIHCYDIRRQAWSVIDAGGDSTVSARGYQICDMIYNPNTGHVYVAFTEAATGTAGLARLDATQAAAQDQISSSGTLPVYFDIIPPPIEARPRADVFVERLFADVECTVANQSATAYYSRDQGATFTATSTARDLNTSMTNYEPERFVIAKGWGSITPRLLITGKAGTGALKLSGLSVDLRVDKQKEHPKRTI